MANGGNITYGIKLKIDSTDVGSVKKQLEDLVKTYSTMGTLSKETGLSPKKLKEQFDAQNTSFKEIQNNIQKVYTSFTSSFNNKMGALDFSKFNHSLETSNVDLGKLYQQLQASGVAGVNTFRNMATSILTANGQMKQSVEWLDKIKTTFSNTLKWGISSSAMNSFTGSIQTAYNYINDLDKSLNNIRIVTKMSSDEMTNFAQQATRAAKTLGVATTDYTDAALIYYQQGLTTEQASERARITSQVSNVTGQSTEAVSEQLTSLWNGYQVALEDSELYVDKLAAVAAASASDLEELSTGMSKVASSANAMGVSADQLAATLSTIISVTRQAPESVGTALKTIYARMADIESGEDDETSLGNYTAEMANLGVNVLNTEGKLRDMGEVIEEVGSKWTKFSREQQLALAQSMAGTRQYNNLIALFDNWSQYENMLSTSQTSAGELSKQQDIYMKSAAAHIQQMKTSWEDFYDSLFGGSDFNILYDSIGGVANLLKNFVDSIGGGSTVLISGLSIATKMLSGPLANAMATFVINTKKTEENLAQAKAQAEVLTKFQNANISDKIVEELIETKTREYKVEKQITEEQDQQINNMLQQKVLTEEQMEQTEQQISKMQNKIQNLFGGFENLTKKDIISTNLVDRLEKVIDLADNFSSKYKNIDKVLEKVKDTEDKIGKSDSISNIQKVITAVNEDLGNKKLKNKNDLQQGLDNFLKSANADTSGDIGIILDSFTKTQGESLNAFKELIKIYNDYETQNKTNEERLYFDPEQENKIINSINQYSELQLRLNKQKEGIKETFLSLKDSIETFGNLKIKDNKIVDGIKNDFKELQDTIGIDGRKSAETFYQAVSQNSIKVRQILNNLDKNIKKTLNKDITNEARESLELLKKNLFDTYDALESKSSQISQNVNTILDTAELSKIYEDIIKSVSSIGDLFSAGNSFINMFKVLKDEDLSPFEKTFQIFSNLGFTLGQGKIAITELWNEINKLKDVFDLIGLTADKGLNTFVTFSEKSVATNLILNKLTKQGIDLEIAAEAVNLRGATAEVIETKAKEKNINATTLGLAVQEAEKIKTDETTIAIYRKAAAYIFANPWILAAAAAAGLLVAGTYAVVKAHNADADAAKAAAEQAQHLTENYNRVSEEAAKLKENISNYEDSKNSLTILDKETEEYKNTLEETNKKARELIESLGLFSQYTIKNGIIEIDKEALNSAQKDLSKKQTLAEQSMYLGKIQSNEANLNLERTEFSRLANKNVSAYIKRGIGTGLLFSGFGSLAGAALHAETTIKDNLSNEETNNIVESLKALSNAELNKLFSSDTQLTNYIKGLDGISIKSNELIDKIVDEKDALLELVESTKKATEANEYYAEQANRAIVESEYGNEIKTIASSAYGGFNEDRYSQILDLVNKSDIQKNAREISEQITNDYLNKTDSGDFDTLGTKGAWNDEGTQWIDAILNPNESMNLRKHLTESLKGKGIGLSDSEFKNLFGVSEIKDNESLARAWANMNGIDISKARWNKNQLVDAAGNVIIDASSKDLRAQMSADIYRTGAVEKANISSQEYTEEDTQNYIKFLGQIQSSATQAGMQYGTDFSEAVLNALASEEGKIDLSSVFSRLDPNEVKEMQGWDPNTIIQNMLGMSTEEAIEEKSKEWVEGFVNSFNKNLKNYNWDIDAAISASISKKSSELEAATDGLSKKKMEQYTEDVEIYARHLMDVADSSEKVSEELKYNSDLAVDFALRIVRMNKAIDTLADNMDNWSDILKNSTDSSQEYAEAMYGIKEAIADIYDVSMDYVSEDFVAKHLAEIQRIATGSEEAIDNLRFALSEDILDQIYEANLTRVQFTAEAIIDKETLFNEFTSLREQLQGELDNLKVGQSLDSQPAIEEIQKIIDGARMTEEQANAFLSSIGYEPVYKTREMQIPKRVQKTQTTHKIIQQEQATDADGKPIPGAVNWTATDEVIDLGTEISNDTITGWAVSGDGNPPKIKELHAAPTGSMNNYSSSNAGGKAPGKSSGGSKKTAKKEDKIDKTKDRYHDINIELKQIETNLKRLQNQQDKLFGQNLLDNLNSQLNYLNRQIDASNRKIAIANGEVAELQGKLAGKGVTFNANGTVANYAAAYDAQLNYVNSVIDQYNAMDAEAQESFKDTLDKTKEDFDKFVENIERYDELVTDFIPGLEDDIQAAIDEQIEIQVEKFNMEIEIRLDMAEAERDWNEFKKRIIDGITDEDILGNAKARLQDFFSYYKDDTTGVIQVNTEHVNDILTELKKMEQGVSDIYGDNQTQALEDLKTYYEQLISDLNDIEDISEDVHQAYLDMMDEAQEKFEEQVSMYEQVSDLIEHDMKIIELVRGEDSYAELGKYYERQEENYNKQIDFQRQQVEFWKEQMAAADEGSEAWDVAKENWVDAVNDWNSAVEEAIENIQDKYLNAIEEIFDKLNNEVTNGMGLEYVNDQWDLINRNADQYLDAINSMYGIQELEKKYLDAIDQTDSVSAQRQLNELMEEQVSALRQKDKLTEYDVERAKMRYEIALKEIALQEAQQSKSSMRLKRDSQGNYRYEFVADDDAVGEAEDELAKLKNELYNFDLEHYRDNLDQVRSIYEEFQEKIKELNSDPDIDPEERAKKELMYREQYGELINGLLEQNNDIRINLHESAFEELADLYELDIENFQNMTDEEQDILLGQLIPQWESGVQQMVDKITGEGGLEPTCKDAFDSIKNATEDYEESLKKLQDTAGTSFDDIINNVDKTIDQTEDLIKDNNELTDSYRKQLQAVQEVIDQLDTLINKYKTAKNEAMAATEAAYKYWQWENGQAADAANRDIANGNGSGWNQNGLPNNNSNNSSAGNNVGGSGNGNGTSGSGGSVSTGQEVKVKSSATTFATGENIWGSVKGNAFFVASVDGDKILLKDPHGPNYTASGITGWVWKRDLEGFRTGGYTGEWSGNNGKFAMLHQKELVLNADDTKNILDAVKIMRTMGDIVINRISALSNGISSVRGIAADTKPIEQNVIINADFPNATDSNEIEKAFNNLMNVASMKMQERDI